MMLDCAWICIDIHIRYEFWIVIVKGVFVVSRGMCFEWLDNVRIFFD